MFQIEVPKVQVPLFPQMPKSFILGGADSSLF